MTYGPLEFAPFEEALEILEAMNPVAKAIVGSYGDPAKAPDQFSDLDLIYVFDTNQIRLLVERCIDRLREIDDLVTIHLGVHFQLGHVISILFRREPLRWIDIGMMDRNFSENYLVDASMKVLTGHIPTCGIPTHPENWMLHLAKKLMQAQLRNNQLYVVTCACRYLTMVEVEAAMKRRVNSPTSGKFALRQVDGAAALGVVESRPLGLLSNDASKIIDAVLLDIRQRFPGIAAAL